MNEPGVTAAQARVLATLREAGRAMTLDELRERTGLHTNTLRGHLDAIVAGGNASRIAARSGGRGRPAWGYLAREPEYAALAMALADGLDRGTGAGADAEQEERADDDRSRTLDPVAMRGGRAWGERLGSQLAAVEDGRERVLLALAHTRFAPQDDGDRITLHACPILDAARAHTAVVCAVHLGLVEGVLGVEGARLQPRPATLGCVVSLP